MVISKLRTQLLLVLLFFGAINISIIIAYIYQSQEHDKIDFIEKTIHSIEVLVHNNAQLINDFFTHEPTNSNFHNSKKSSYLKEYKHSIDITYKYIKSLPNTSMFMKLKSDDLIEHLIDDLDVLTELVDSASSLIQVRGFKDYGLVGKMRNHAHYIEDYELIPTNEILMLRRHEKDYIIRNEKQYIDKFNHRINTNKKILKSEDVNGEKANSIRELNDYQTLFMKLVHVDSLISKRNNESLQNQISRTIEIVLFDAGIVRKNCETYISILNKRIKYINYIALVAIIFLSLLLSIKLSKLVTNRISILSVNISEFISSCFTKNNAVEVLKRNDEVGILIGNFEVLKQNITDHLNYLEIKVSQRTEEINTQKEQIQIQNKKLMDSLKYALNIQEAILPDKENIMQSFPEHLILFKPKDLVSGDFYWHKKVKKGKNELSIFAIADCTGHGVPGAFMSMLGIAFLNEISLQNKFKNSADILNKLRKKIIETLSQQYKAKKLEDGMDISLIIVNHKSKKIQFSGAQRDLLLARNGEMIIYKGDRMPISKHIKDNDSFTFKEIEFISNDMLYLFSDGYADQFGGTNESKYLRRRLRNLLTQISFFSIEKQKLILETEINGWMGNLDQTDDICLAGIKMQ